MSDISGLDTRMRMPGLATGMDTDAMIKKMMAAENIKMDKMKQNRQYAQWRQDAYRDIIKDLRDIRNNYFLTGSPSDTNLIKSESFTGSSITSSTPNIVTATALPGAANGVSSIVVKQIATGAKINGNKLEKTSGDLTTPVTLSTKLSELGITNESATPGKFTIDLGNSQTATIEVNKDMKVQDLISKIYSTKIDNTDKTLYSQIKVNFSELTGNLSIETRDTGSDKTLKIYSGDTKGNNIDENILKSIGMPKELTMGLTPRVDVKLSDTADSTTTLASLYGDFGSDTLNFNVGGNLIAVGINSGDSIQKVIDSINAKGNLQASFDPTSKKLTIGTKDGKNLGISPGTAPIPLSNTLVGQDAKVEITPSGSNSPVPVTKSSNNFNIDNITYNITKPSEKDASGNYIATTLTTVPDAKKSIDKIKGFVDKYNALVKKITDKIQEKKEYNYKPLTDDQKKDMKEDQIKTWEDKAKQGILKNDGDLQSILFGMRNALTAGVESAGISLKEIGIDTYGSFEAATKPGQLKIDEAKLKDALENRGDQVMKLFTSTVSDADVKDVVDNKFKELYPKSDDMDEKTKSSIMVKLTQEAKFPGTGIFKRIEGLIYASAEKSDGILITKAGYTGSVREFDNTITKQLKEQDKSITEMNKKLATKQERYYQMFARLETAMNKMNAQQSWLTQQLGGGR